MLSLLLVFAALGSAVGITTPQDLALDEANCNTCALSAAPDQKITHDPACLPDGGMGCISTTASVFNGCRYCETAGFEDISCETDTCKHSEIDLEPTMEPTMEGSEDQLEVTTGLDAPPYIAEEASSGVIINLLKLCLEPKEVTFVQIPFGELQDAVGDKKNPHAILAPVQELALENPLKKPMHFSNVFFSAHNVAITHKGNPLKDFKDLAGKPVFSWDGAWKDLGPKFKAMYAPEKKEHKNLKQFEDQKEQVSEWKDSPDGVLVIGRAIFEVYAHELEISTEKLTMSKIFGDNTDFKAAFRDEKLRDSFNKNLEKICKDGAYEKVLEEYKLSAQGSLEEVCK